MNDLIQVTESEVEKVRKFYKIEEKKINQDIEILKVWKKQKIHLPDLDDALIGRLLLRNKFRIEQTKEKIEKYFTLRGNIKEFFEGTENLQLSQQSTTLLPMPKLTGNSERISVVKFLNSDPEKYDVYCMAKVFLAIGELVLRNDYAIGDRFVIDFSGFSLKHLGKLHILPLAKQLYFCEQAYSCRILGVECINLPSYASKIMGLIKLILSPKIYDKLRIHKDLDSLHKIVPKEFLPVEYEGTGYSLDNILEKWTEEFKNQREFFIENYETVCKEELKIGDSGKDSFGTDGTFRTLHID